MPFDPDKFLGAMQAPTQQQASPSFNPGQLAEQGKIAQAMQSAITPGSAPHLALPESPLSPMERGAFGWLKKPTDQKKHLEDTYGQGNVQLTKMDDGKAGFVVKTNDGKWRQVDPAGLSDIPMDLLKGQLGQAMSRVTNFNLKNSLGGAAQFLGEHGFDTAGAAAGGIAGTAMAGPIGGVLGGAVGGASGGLADAGVRKALDYLGQATGQKIPGAENVTGDDLQHQVMSSMLFGGAQELAGPFLKAGTTGAAKILGSVVSKFGDTPEAKQGIASIIQFLGGTKEGLARVYADSPKEVGSYINTAVSDRVNSTSQIQTAQKRALSDFYDQAQGARAQLGKQYDAIDKAASNKTLNALAVSGDGANTITDTMSQLIDQKYLDSAGQILKPGMGEINRNTSGVNGSALNQLISDAGTVASKNGQVAFKDVKIMKENLENYLFGQNQVTDGNLRKIMMNYRSGLETMKSQALHDVDPALSQRLASLNEKYGPVKELLGTLGSKTEDERLDGFLKQVIRDDGSHNSELMNSISSLLGIDNPTKNVLQMEAAKAMAKPFTGSGNVNLAGFKLPASPRLARAFVDNVASPQQDFVGALNKNAVKPAQDAIAPYLTKMHEMYKSLPDEMRATLIKSPEAIGVLGHMMAGSAISEKQDQQNLLGQSGAFQSSQFGQ